MTMLVLCLTRRPFPAYSLENSPKEFTQTQPFACLIVKAGLAARSGGVEELLFLTSAVGEELGLYSVPRFTTLLAFADRPNILALVDGVLASIGRAALKATPQDATIDGAGSRPPAPAPTS